MKNIYKIWRADVKRDKRLAEIAKKHNWITNEKWYQFLVKRFFGITIYHPLIYWHRLFKK